MPEPQNTESEQAQDEALPEIVCSGSVVLRPVGATHGE